MNTTQHVLSLSYGKDSLATLEAIRLLGYPLDRIIHAEIWATDTVQADLPPMVEFKAHADRIIKERYGIEVEHICAMKDGEKLTYEKMFYHKPERRASRESTQSEVTMPVVRGKTQTTFLTRDFLSPEERGAKSSKPKRQSGSIYGFPISIGRGNYCTKLKLFQRAPIIGCGHKYGDVSRHSGRRANSYRAA